MTASDQWNHLLDHLLKGSARNISPRGEKTREFIAMRTLVDMRYPVMTNIERDISLKFMTAEAEWILSGSNELGPLLDYAPSISRFSDDGRRLQGAYGVMFAEQVRYVCETLLSDNITRQAVMTFWRPNPRQSKDVPCTVSLQFLLRDGEINTVATMRSSDAWLGWPYDVFSFTMITAYVALSCYKTLELGQLYLTAGSQHLYESNREAAMRCLWGKDRTYSPISLHDFNTPDDLRKCLRNFRNGQHDQLPPNFIPELWTK